MWHKITEPVTYFTKTYAVYNNYYPKLCIMHNQIMWELDILAIDYVGFFKLTPGMMIFQQNTPNLSDALYINLFSEQPVYWIWGESFWLA